MQEVKSYRVGRLLFRSLSLEGAARGKPLERLEIEIGPLGSRARSERVAQIVIGVVVALAAMTAVTVWQPFLGPMMVGAGLIAIILMMRYRANKQVGRRLTADANEIRVEATSPLKDETRVTLDVRSVERVDVGEEAHHRTLWAQTRSGDRVVLLDDLTDEEAEASAKKLRDTIPPPPAP